MTPPHFYIFWLSPLWRGPGSLFETNLNFLHPMIICIMFNWIWPAGSGEDSLTLTTDWIKFKSWLVKGNLLLRYKTVKISQPVLRSSGIGRIESCIIITYRWENEEIWKYWTTGEGKVQCIFQPRFATMTRQSFIYFVCLFIATWAIFQLSCSFILIFVGTCIAKHDLGKIIFWYHFAI
jgi:hypothetical protein